MGETEHVEISPSPAERSDGPGCARASWLGWALTAWMLGAMLTGWIIFDGPVVSSLVKRIDAVRAVRDALAGFFGG